MNRAVPAMLRSTLVGLMLVAPEVLADDQSQFREAWKARSEEEASVVYVATGTTRTWEDEGTRPRAKQVDVSIEARMKCDERKFRFDVQAKDAAAASFFILDPREFHTCRRPATGSWEVVSARSISLESDWPYFYPFLLAHGTVPLPPLAVPRTSSTDQPPKDAVPVRNRETTFTFAGDEPLSVTVMHDINGLIGSYKVFANNRELLTISNTYKRDGATMRLDRFSVVALTSDGRPAKRLDARVEQYRTDVPLAEGLFTKPRELKVLQKDLIALMNKTATVKERMTLDELARALQDAIGSSMLVRFDDETFQGRREVNVDALRFEAGEAKLSELLSQDFRKNRLDFVFEAQGITLIPRSRAWAHAEQIEYLAGDFGLELSELQKTIYESAVADDWGDVGGPALMLTDEQQGRLLVFHAQSDHLRFLDQLTKLTTDGPEER